MEALFLGGSLWSRAERNLKGSKGESRDLQGSGHPRRSRCLNHLELVVFCQPV